MAAKEATVYVVDVGSTMGERSMGREETNFDWAMRYVWDKLTTTVATGRKTLLSGVVALRSDDTDNELGHDEHYQHISVLCDLKQVLMPDIRQLRQQLKPSATAQGDIVSALIIAIQMISTTCKKLQYVRRIILVTDARASMVTDDLAEISSKLKDDQIELIILGIDFDDPDVGFKEEDKDRTKADNEAILKQMCDDGAGTFASIAQAIDELDVPRIKAVRPTPSYRGFLTLGSPSEYGSAFTINVERYPKTMVARPPSASQFVIRSNANDNDNARPDNADGLIGIKNARTYQVIDSEAPGGKREVEADDLAKGYEYGSTAVYISESDQNVTLFETDQGLDIIGFVNAQQYSRFFDMSRTNVIVAEARNDKASMALSSFIHALYELDSYAVARLVPKQNKQPLIVLLAPSVEADMECLYDVELPFVEDIRLYRFPPLDRIITISGKVIAKHRNLPSDDLQAAMDRFVDDMDLSTANQDAEYMPMDETYSPILHHLNKVIQFRAIYPDAEPPPPADILTRFSRPPTELVDAARASLDQIIRAADVKKVPPKARGKRFGKKEEKPLSNLDVGALLASDPKRKQKQISSKNAVPEFKQLLAAASSVDNIHDACRQLQKIVRDWIRHSVGDSGYGRALEATRVMREEMNELEEPAVYNNFLHELRDEINAEKLGGARKDFWWLLRVNRMGPIHSRECNISEVTEEDAKAFMVPQASGS